MSLGFSSRCMEGSISNAETSPDVAASATVHTWLLFLFFSRLVCFRRQLSGSCFWSPSRGRQRGIESGSWNFDGGGAVVSQRAVNMTVRDPLPGRAWSGVVGTPRCHQRSEPAARRAEWMPTSHLITEVGEWFSPMGFFALSSWCGSSMQYVCVCFLVTVDPQHCFSKPECLPLWLWWVCMMTPKSEPLHQRAPSGRSEAHRLVEETN